MDDDKGYLKLRDEATERMLNASWDTAMLSARLGGGMVEVEAVFGFGSCAETVTLNLLMGESRDTGSIVEQACKVAASLEGSVCSGTCEMFLICVRVDGRIAWAMPEPDGRRISLPR